MGWETEHYDQVLGRLLERLESRGCDSSDFNSSFEENVGDSQVCDVAGFLMGETQESVDITEASSKRRPREISTPVQIGPFNVIRLLGSGGFGAVFLVQKDGDSKPLALKLLHLDKSQSRISFFREWFLTSELRHPEVVSSYEIGEFEGQPYFTMDYIEGRALNAVIAQAKEDRKNGVRTESYFDSLLRSAIQASRGLSFLHRNGLIHRDIKPGNILIDLKGQARLSDLGLSIQEGLQDERTIGTFPYSSPEQIENKTLSVQSDIFSLGVTFYEAFCLRKPFYGANRKEISEAILFYKPIAPRVIDPEIPVEVEAILLRCLEKNPAHRYASADELVRALESVSTKAQFNSRSKSAIKILGGVVAFSLITAVALGMFSPSEKVPLPNSVAEVPEQIEIEKILPEPIREQSKPVKARPVKTVNFPERTLVQNQNAPAVIEATRDIPPVTFSKAVEGTKNESLQSIPAPSSEALWILESSSVLSQGLAGYRETLPKLDSSKDSINSRGPFFLVCYNGRGWEPSSLLNGFTAPEIRARLDFYHESGYQWLIDLAAEKNASLQSVYSFALQIDGVYNVRAFNFSNTSNFKSQFLDEVGFYRSLLERNKSVVISGEKDLNTIMALTTLVRRSGDKLFFRSPYSWKRSHDWSDLPKNLGEPLERDFSWSRTRPSVVSRKFEHATLSIDLEAASNPARAQSAVNIEWEKSEKK